MNALLDYARHFAVVPSIFLALQAMVLYVGAEVVLRYARWYVSTTNKEGLLLRSLILGIAITHFAIILDRATWIYETLINPAATDRLSAVMTPEFTRLLFIRFGLFVGIVVHLLPIWRIVYRASWSMILWKIFYRSAIAVTAYFIVLWFLGSFYCLTTDAVCLMN